MSSRSEEPDLRMSPIRARKPLSSAAFALLCGMLAGRCSSSSTSVVAPTSDKCQISVSNNPSSFGAAGGGGSVTIATSRDCAWSIASEAPWVSIVGDHGGQGEAVVAYAVAANAAPTPRSGSIAVGSEKVQLSQAGAPCRFDLSRSRDSIGPAGGRLAVDVNTMSGCPWDATSGTGWITVSSGQTGNASGTVGLTVTANAGVVRIGSVKIAGQNFSVTQDAAPTPAPTPPPAPAPTPTPPTTPAPTPSPAPTPTPSAPPPTPAPPPPGSRPVQFEGTVSALSGRCPDVSFTADGRRVVANKDTGYKSGRCGDLSNGDRVAITGTTIGNTVTATRIELKKAKHDD
jgi:hypothetical protein